MDLEWIVSVTSGVVLEIDEPYLLQYFASLREVIKAMADAAIRRSSGSPPPDPPRVGHALAASVGVSASRLAGDMLVAIPEPEILQANVEEKTLRVALHPVPG